MIELSIPQLGEEIKQAKDLVFSILTKEHPLSLIELSNRVRKEYNLQITYQAVRKAVDVLHRQGVLTKKEKKYDLNKEWILKTKTFFDKLLTTYETGKEVHAFTAELVKENYAVYSFRNLFELDNFWSDIMYYWADHLKPGENRKCLFYGHYVWWPIINLGSETKLYEYFKKKNINKKFIFLRDLPLNHWGASFYRTVHTETKVIEKKEVGEMVDVDILGDLVLQVKYPSTLSKKLRIFFEKYKSTKEMSMKEITKIAYESHDIKFIVFKNPAIAKNLRETYEKY